MNPHFVPLTGSERELLPGSRLVGAVDPNERIEVSVYLKPRSDKSLANEIGTLRQPMTREEYAANYGADPKDIASVEQFAQGHGLTVVEASVPRRVVILSGTVAAMNAAFNVSLQRYEHEGGAYRGRVGPIHMPADIAASVEGVFGLDDRRQAHTRFRYIEAATGSLQAHVVTQSYTASQVADLYNFPKAGNGQGQTVALIELGGGYQQSDLSAYFSKLGIPQPSVSSVSVDNGKNAPAGTPGSADGEVALDIEVVGAVAPGAHIIVYFAPNTDQGFIDCVTQAIHDTTNNPSILSISWGGPESTWTGQAMRAMDQAFQAAAALGVTVCCAAGDNGSSDGVTDGLAHVDFPCSSSYALACGGTRLEATGTQIVTEVVWNNNTAGATGGGATGGGVSDVFALPTWQTNAHVPPSINPGGHVGRGVPDVAGDADPQTGYQVRVDGQDLVFGGTSAVAPLWAGLLALVNQQLGKPVGYLNPVLYQQLARQSVSHDITSGTNGGYQAAVGWDACTGFGSPNGATLLSALTAKK